MFFPKLKFQFFFYYNLWFIYFCILFYLLYFVEILFLILIAFTKYDLFCVTSFEYWSEFSAKYNQLEFLTRITLILV